MLYNVQYSIYGSVSRSKKMLYSVLRSKKCYAIFYIVHRGLTNLRSISVRNTVYSPDVLFTILTCFKYSVRLC